MVNGECAKFDKRKNNENTEGGHILVVFIKKIVLRFTQIVCPGMIAMNVLCSPVDLVFDAAFVVGLF